MSVNSKYFLKNISTFVTDGRSIGENINDHSDKIFGISDQHSMHWMCRCKKMCFDSDYPARVRSSRGFIYCSKYFLRDS